MQAIGRDAGNWQFVIHTLLDCNNVLNVCDGTSVIPEAAAAGADRNKWLK